MIRPKDLLLLVCLLPCLTLAATTRGGEMKTWDGRHSIKSVRVSMVYFLPKDRKPLPDWRERIDYYAKRIAKFHQREYQGQSKLIVDVEPKPFVSELDTPTLREGDGNAIFFRTLREVDRRLKFAAEPDEAFPILLVMSDINWRPLDDFYRLKPTDEGPKFEGNFTRLRHFPGAASGGARATYIAQRRKGWGLVSADGWRVPYSGSDCVAYHEGVGHTVGLPHPQPGNGSVMSLGQYRGWINESWLDDDQKKRMGWTEQQAAVNRKDLFSVFVAPPEPPTPGPGQPFALRLRWPEGAKVKSLRVRWQDDLWSSWNELPVKWDGDAPQEIKMPAFDKPTPLSYRVDAELEDGQSVELWGYLQVRARPNLNPLPKKPSPDLPAVDKP